MLEIYGIAPNDGSFPSGLYILCVMLLCIMSIMFCIKFLLGIVISHYSLMLCIRSSLRKPLFLLRFVYGYHGSTNIRKAIVLNCSVVLFTTLVRIFVCKGSRNHVLSFSIRGLVSQGYLSIKVSGLMARGSGLLDGFSLL